MLNSIPPAVGKLLISAPFMADPDFKRSVIFITEYHREGAVGFVLNHHSDNMLGDLLPDVSYSDIPVYNGGPVAANTLHFVHRCPEKIQGGLKIWNGIYWGGDFNTVKSLINNYQLNQEEIKFFTGYSGWTAGQLEDELKEDTWIVSGKFDPDTIFAEEDNNLWKQVIIGLGQRYAHIANFPENPTLN